MKTKEFPVFPRAPAVSKLDWQSGSRVFPCLELGSFPGIGISPWNWDLSLELGSLPGCYSSGTVQQIQELPLSGTGVFGNLHRAGNSLTQEWELQGMFWGFASSQAGIWDSKEIICWESRGNPTCFFWNQDLWEGPAGGWHIQVLFPVKRNSCPQLFLFILPPSLVRFSLPRTPPIPILSWRNPGKMENREKKPKCRFIPQNTGNLDNSNLCSLGGFHIPGGGNSLIQFPSPRRESSWSHFPAFSRQEYQNFLKNSREFTVLWKLGSRAAGEGLGSGRVRARISNPGAKSQIPGSLDG